MAAYSANGVTITETELGIVGQDDSGHGAVLCAWYLYINLAGYLDACFPDEDRDVRDELGKGIDAINDFIVTNSLKPVPKKELEAYVFAERVKALAIPRTLNAPLCAARPEGGESGEALAKFRNHLSSVPREQFRAEIRYLLSVPRPPVMNPCL